MCQMAECAILTHRVTIFGRMWEIFVTPRLADGSGAVP